MRKCNCVPSVRRILQKTDNIFQCRFGLPPLLFGFQLRLSSNMRNYTWLFVLAELLLVAVRSTASGAADLDVDHDSPEPQHPFSRGYADYLDWVHWDDARDVAKQENKPIMLLIHKSWCGACKALKITLEVDDSKAALQDLAKEFIVTNTMDDEEPWEDEYKPDGRYIPRILFLYSDGRLMKEVSNPKGAFGDYKYYYSSAEEIATSMKKALETSAQRESGTVKPPSTGSPPSSSPPQDKEEKKKKEL